MDPENATLRRQLPHGLGDLIYEQAAARSRLEELALGAFKRWGYQRIVVPTFEYYASMVTGQNASSQQGMYRFFNRNGEAMALRSDMTVPTARVVATKLYDQPMPVRFCYSGSVFRFGEPQAGRRREFTQAGIELIGADTPEADAEALCVAISALRAMGMTDPKIAVGTVSYLKAILEPIGLAPADYTLIEQVIGRRNQIELDATIQSLGLRDETAKAVAALPQMYGDQQTLGRALDLAPNETACAAVERLARVVELLSLEGYARYVTLDLAEVRSMGYYTGITFHGFVKGLGYHVCGGGRYDNLLSSFGADLPAVGFAIGIERAQLVTQPKVSVVPDILVSDDREGIGRRLAQAARAAGLSAEVDVLGRSGRVLVEYGHRRGIPRIAQAQDGVITLSTEGDEVSVNIEDLVEEMATWTC